MSVVKEFKTFAMRGNVIDLAIGIIIGTAFGKIVSSLVTDVLMPPIGTLLGGVDFSSIALTIKESTGNAPAVTMKWGVFINTIIDFIIVAFVVFMVVKTMNTMRKKEPVPAPEPTEKQCPECMMVIPITARRCGHCTSVVK